MDSSASPNENGKLDEVDTSKAEKSATSNMPINSVVSSNQLPETGETDSTMVFGAAAMAILAGLGLVAPRKKEE